jgi:hypothetical protein
MKPCLEMAELILGVFECPTLMGLFALHLRELVRDNLHARLDDLDSVADLQPDVPQAGADDVGVLGQLETRALDGDR